MKPPEAQPPAPVVGSTWNSHSPPELLMCMRRKGAACDTAIVVVLLVASEALTAKFSNDRQKLQVALRLGIQYAGTLAPPSIYCMLTCCY